MAKSTSIFKTKWELECCVKASSRNATTGAVENVVCLFCRAFGREDPDETENRKRKRTQNIQSFSAPWRMDKLTKHNNLMHSKKWAEYKACSLSQNKTFLTLLWRRSLPLVISRNQMMRSKKFMWTKIY